MSAVLHIFKGEAGSVSYEAYVSAVDSSGNYNVRLAEIAKKHGLLPDDLRSDLNGYTRQICTGDEKYAMEETLRLQREVTAAMDDLEKFMLSFEAAIEYKGYGAVVQVPPDKR